MNLNSQLSCTCCIEMQGSRSLLRQVRRVRDQCLMQLGLLHDSVRTRIAEVLNALQDQQRTSLAAAQEEVRSLRGMLRSTLAAQICAHKDSLTPAGCLEQCHDIAFTKAELCMLDRVGVHLACLFAG